MAQQTSSLLESIPSPPEIVARIRDLKAELEALQKLLIASHMKQKAEESGRKAKGRALARA